MKNVTKLLLCLTVAAPAATAAASDHFSPRTGPSAGDREFSISGTGSNDANFDNGTFGVVAEHGWYLQPHLVWGIRQSINYASIKGENLRNDYWNGSTRAYIDYQFGSDRARPFVGGSLGLIYGDGNNNSAFSGLEGGMKYYALPSTYLLSRVEYQWFFSGIDEATSSFSDGAFAYTLGIGYNY
ncbi:MAG: hypothetical protein LAT62_07045 [Natronospirillum sp.]|uniref:outer membrane beta-barrel protein n=1 Tax=Natronospirillum sp. TaxID=2812955 RepID=UPI0025E9058F|nr:outer membrane beta-barrel protein [Natronospirillum sp.]MCH8551673.1 hypothetical protein [Natronospirillum sp.]